MPTLAYHSGMEIVTRTEALALLRRHHVGRLGFVVDGRPMILPLNYTMLYADIVFRTALNSALDVPPGSEVAFEVDEFDDANATGWSVLVQGVTDVISEDDDWFARTLRDASAAPWAPGAKGQYVRIRPTVISGRRIPTDPVAPN